METDTLVIIEMSTNLRSRRFSLKYLDRIKNRCLPEHRLQTAHATNDILNLCNIVRILMCRTKDRGTKP